MKSRTTVEELHHRAQELGLNLPPLLVAADQVAAVVTQGIHGRRRVGQGETFWEFRRYKFGDPAQSIDWRQSAKSDRIYIRETEREAAQSVWLWRDETNSMNFSSKRSLPSKLERATLLELALASLLHRGGEHVALAGHSNSTKLSLLEMAETLSREPDRTTSVILDEEIPRDARMVFFGDFLDDPEDLKTTLKGLAGRGITGVLIKIYDPAEQTLPYNGRVQFEGLEREPALLIDRVEPLREEYQRAWSDHHDDLARFTSSIGWSLLSHDTSSPPEDVLMQLYLQLSDDIINEYRGSGAC